MTTKFYGHPVTSLQTMLRTVAQITPSQPTVVADGVYGEQTRLAVTEFQRQHGLETTGIADYETWETLSEAYRQAAVEVAPAAPLQIEMDCGQVMLPGCRNCHIYLIQAMLTVLSETYPELRDVRITGAYDEMTQKAVRWLQSCCGEKCSGIFNKSMWKSLCALYTLKTGNGEKPDARKV